VSQDKEYLSIGEEYHVRLDAVWYDKHFSQTTVPLILEYTV